MLPPGLRTRLRSTAFAVADLVLAGLYLAIAHLLDWSSDTVFLRASYALAALAVVAAVGTVMHRRWGRWLAAGACLALLALGIGLVVLLGLSAGFLWGIYGSFGRSAALLTGVLAAVAIELYALLPFFQLRFLLGEARRGDPGPAPSSMPTPASS